MEFEGVSMVGYVLAAFFLVGLLGAVIVWRAVSSALTKVDNMDIKVQSHEFKIANQDEDLKELKSAWKANNDSLRALNQTISSFDLNARQQHQEIKILVSDNTKVMQEVVNLLNKK